MLITLSFWRIFFDNDITSKICLLPRFYINFTNYRLRVFFRIVHIYISFEYWTPIIAPWWPMVVIVTIYQEAFVTVCIFQTTWFMLKKLTASEKVHREIHLVSHVIKPLKPDWKMTGLSFKQTGKPAPKEWFKFVPSSVKISRVIMKKSR